ncbi:MAG: hypothetical protein H6867_00800 [Rhodospirillales bacterium]|nr:hypothetical protein [Rhodospirillales bacterium]MCB9996802.1 hypothetical protein [Rhodospirillales bacterium]
MAKPILKRWLSGLFGKRGVVPDASPVSEKEESLPEPVTQQRREIDRMLEQAENEMRAIRNGDRVPVTWVRKEGGHISCGTVVLNKQEHEQYKKRLAEENTGSPVVRLAEALMQAKGYRSSHQETDQYEALRYKVLTEIVKQRRPEQQPPAFRYGL